MRSKYNNGELVKVNGFGKIYGKVKNKLGFILEKDAYFADYYISLIFGKKDWFPENAIERVLGKKKNKVEKYQIALCTTKEGYSLIQEKLKENEPISNNKFKNMQLYEEFKRDNKEYIAIGWYSAFWPITNKSIRIMENTIQTFRKANIPYQYIVLNEENLNDIEIYQFSENDNNVDVFYVERKIKIKNLNEKPHFEW